MFGFVDGVEIDFITNGRGEGAVASRFQEVNFDAGMLRPMVMNDGQKYVWLDTGRTEPTKDKDGSLVKNDDGTQRMAAVREPIPLQRIINSGMLPATFNAAALPYQAWQRIDTGVTRAARQRLSAWNDLAAANTYGGFNGMGVTGIIRDTKTDPGDAKVDMNMETNDLNDASLFTPDIIPLPVIHSGSTIMQRQLAVSRNSGMPLDTDAIEACGRRCAETLEKMTIGIDSYSTLVIGSSTDFTNRGIYGFRTHPDRITKTNVTASSSFVPSTFVTEVMAMKELARAQNFFGPFVLYYSTSWDQYMGRDYYYQATAAGLVSSQQTVLDRVQRIPGISRVAMLDFYSSTDELLLVQMSAETVRAVDGMDWTTVQWDEHGGAKIVLRVMGIKVPDIKSQYIGQSTTSRKAAVVHGTTS